MVKTTSKLLSRIPSTPRQCRECPTVFTPFSATAITDRFLTLCPECAEKMALEDQRQFVINQMNGTPNAKPSIVPDEFRDTVAHRLPRPNFLQKVLAWKFNPKGLTLYGPTGLGKSRCVWVLIEREHKAGRSVRVLNARSGFDYARDYGADAAAGAVLIDKLLAADILLLDDAFKAHFTPSYEGALYAAVSMRLEDCKPVITTMNDTSESLAARMSADRGAPLIRRLRESSTIINFA